jgi:hypothetical protein
MPQALVSLAIFLWQRSREPSTHAALAAVAVALAQLFPAWSNIFNAVALAFGGAGYALPERGRTSSSAGPGDAPRY